MLFEPGYTYETKNIVKSFLGTMKADGFFEPVSETEYGGYIKVAGKKPMPCPGGIVRRENKQTREAFADYHWPNREKYNWK